MKNIIFVDDERVLLDGLRARLYRHRNDWQMQFALSGEEAIALFEKEPVDLIVSDVRMPFCSGLDVLEEVHRSRCRTPVLLMTAFGDRGLSNRVRALGGRLLDKPFTPLALRKAVRELLGRG